MAVRVLIVDDSVFFRRRLAEIIASDPQLSVVGMAGDGLQAIELAQTLKPDIITMDVEMPVMDGITAIRKIMATQPTPILMLSTWTIDGAKSTLDALEAGAIDYIPKQFNDISTDRKRVAQHICQRLVKLAKSSLPQPNTVAIKKTKFAVKPTRFIAAVRPVSNSLTAKLAIKLVAIGTSTGGPVALQKVLTQLPSNFPYPIILVQHMPANFTPSFAERLNEQCEITIKQAENGEKLKAATAYLAPGGMQMLVKGSAAHPYIEIESGLASLTYKPCIDITFASIAKVYPKYTLAIILTGMGADGCNGCQRLQQQGSTIWAQDRQSSTIYGMPDAVAKAGICDEILDINSIGHQLAGLK